MIEHARNVMGDRGHHLTPAARGKFGEQRSGELAAHVGKGVAVEEKKRSVPVAGAEKAKRLAGAGF